MKSNRRLVVALVASLSLNVAAAGGIIVVYAQAHRALGGASTMGKARVVEVIENEVDGFRARQLIAVYDGNKIVLDDIGALLPGHGKTSEVGDVVDVREKRQALWLVKLLTFTIRPVASGTSR